MEEHVDEVILELVLLRDDHVVALAEVVADDRNSKRQKFNVVAFSYGREDLLIDVRQGQVLDLIPQFGGDARNVIDDHLVEKPALRRYFVYFLQVHSHKVHHVFVVIIRVVHKQERAQVQQARLDVLPYLLVQGRLDDLRHSFDASRSSHLHLAAVVFVLAQLDVLVEHFDEYPVQVLEQVYCEGANAIGIVTNEKLKSRYNLLQVVLLDKFEVDFEYIFEVWFKKLLAFRVGNKRVECNRSFDANQWTFIIC